MPISINMIIRRIIMRSFKIKYEVHVTKVKNYYFVGATCGRPPL